MTARRPERGRLVAVSGPAAAGKSTVARALQAELSGRGCLWVLVQIDRFVDSLTRDWFAIDAQGAPFAERGFQLARSLDGALYRTIGPDGRRVLGAFHRSVAAILGAGVSVVCETVVCDRVDWRDWSTALEGFETYWIRLCAPLEVLRAREERDRAPILHGLAEGDLSREVVGRYDLELDTARGSIESIVEQILLVLPESSTDSE